MKQKKVGVNGLFVLGSKTILAYIVFIVSFFAIPVYKDAKAVLEKNMLGVYGTQIVLGEESISVKFAETQSERTIGLSETPSLAQNKGMYFVFEEPDYHGIWMKDMNFPIDIIWLSSGEYVVHIEENVSPETYPTVFKPRQKSLYVLEVNAGFVKKAGIKIGDQAVRL